MEQIGGADGTLWIALAAVLVGTAVTGSLRARRAGREPGEWTLLLPGAVTLLAAPFVLLWMIAATEPATDTKFSLWPVPEWAFAETTATLAGIVAGLAVAAWAICYFVRGRMQYRLGVEADEAFWRHRREKSGNE